MSRRAARGRLMDASGFTLTEVMITVVVAGVLGGALMALVLGQQRFYGESDDGIGAQQNIRAAMDLVAAELRMAGPTDVIQAQADSVVVRFDLVRAVACDTTGADELTVFVYDSVTNANLPTAFRGAAYSNPYDSAFNYPTTEPFTSNVTQTGGTAQASCLGRGAPTTGIATDYRRVTGWNAGFGSRPDPGALIRWYGALSYGFAPSTSGSGTALFRNATELVTPFEAGARFEYVMANGTVQSAVAPANFDQIRRVRVTVAAIGGGSNRYGVRRPVTYDIPFRN